MKINKIIKAIINNQTMKINCKIMKKNISKKKIKKLSIMNNLNK